MDKDLKDILNGFLLGVGGLALLFTGSCIQDQYSLPRTVNTRMDLNDDGLADVVIGSSLQKHIFLQQKDGSYMKLEEYSRTQKTESEKYIDSIRARASELE